MVDPTIILVNIDIPRNETVSQRGKIVNKSREERYKDIYKDKTRKYRSIEWKRVVDNGGRRIREKRN